MDCATRERAAALGGWLGCPLVSPVEVPRHSLVTPTPKQTPFGSTHVHTEHIHLRIRTHVLSRGGPASPAAVQVTPFLQEAI